MVAAQLRDGFLSAQRGVDFKAINLQQRMQAF